MKTLLLILLISSQAFAVSYKATLSQDRIIRVDDGATIPVNPQNKDYQAFLQWQSEGGVITPADPAPTAQEIVAILRAQAIAITDTDASSDAKALRGVILVLIDELNILRERDRDRSTDVAAATTLADLKTRWAARSALNDRNISQVKPAIAAKINAGAAD